MVINSYFSIADEDRKYLMEAYKNGWVANYMASMSQNICERYMKHLINQYSEPDSPAVVAEKSAALRTHNLRNLISYIKNNMGYEFEPDAKNEMLNIGNFYFTTRYPGEDSYIVEKDDIESCVKAVNSCRAEIIRMETDLLTVKIPVERELTAEENQRLTELMKDRSVKNAEPKESLTASVEKPGLQPRLKR